MIYFPHYQGTSEQSPLDAVVHSPAKDTVGQEVILLVEDEPAILEIATMMLLKHGYTVLAANRPEDALRLAKEQAGGIHLLITDVIMPTMNGRDLADAILSQYPHLKCLFMSGYAANIIAQHGILDERVNFIQKPFSLSELSAKVRMAIDGK
jgi:DNA-binding NtrC family response regulator